MMLAERYYLTLEKANRQQPEAVQVWLESFGMQVTQHFPYQGMLQVEATLAQLEQLRVENQRAVPRVTQVLRDDFTPTAYALPEGLQPPSTRPSGKERYILVLSDAALPHINPIADELAQTGIAVIDRMPTIGALTLEFDGRGFSRLQRLQLAGQSIIATLDSSGNVYVMKGDFLGALTHVEKQRVDQSRGQQHG